MPRIMENYLPKFMEKYLPVTILFLAKFFYIETYIMLPKMRIIYLQQNDITKHIGGQRIQLKDIIYIIFNSTKMDTNGAEDLVD